MSVQKKLYYKIAFEALENAAIWLNEANHLLFEKKSVGHSCSLAIFSLEESIKAWICFSVGVGIMSPDDELVKKVFSSHYDKIEAITYLNLVMLIPELHKSFYQELSQDEKERAFSFLTENANNLNEYLEHVNDLRKKGICVDVLENKLVTPKHITLIEAENIFIYSLQTHRILETIIRIFNEADKKNKEQYVKEVKKHIKFAERNLQNLF